MRSRVIPFFPRFWKAGLCGVIVSVAVGLVPEDDESPEEAVVVTV